MAAAVVAEPDGPAPTTVGPPSSMADGALTPNVDEHSRLLPATGVALLRRLVDEAQRQPIPVSRETGDGAGLPAVPFRQPMSQTTFNVTVHVPGGFEDESAMADRLTRILIDEARRHGIDVG